MTLRNVPPAILLALGLGGCGDDSGDDTDTISACLLCAPEGCPVTTDGGTTDGTDDHTSGNTTSGSDDGTADSTGGDSSESDVGPCLRPMVDTSSDGSSDDDSSSGDSDGSSSGSPADAEPTDARAWASAFERVSASLPADVAARLRDRGGAR